MHVNKTTNVTVTLNLKEVEEAIKAWVEENAEHGVHTDIEYLDLTTANAGTANISFTFFGNEITQEETPNENS